MRSLVLVIGVLVLQLAGSGVLTKLVQEMKHPKPIPTRQPAPSFSGGGNSGGGASGGGGGGFG